MKKKKGAALLVVVIVMMAAFMMAAFMLDASVKNSRAAVNTLDSTKAYYSAETGVYDFINYTKNNIKSGGSCTLTQSFYIQNYYNANGLYGNDMASYKTTLNSPVSAAETGNSKVYSFKVYSTGSYGTQSYVITADVSMIYTKNAAGVFNYTNYRLDSKHVYKTQ